MSILDFLKRVGNNTPPRLPKRDPSEAPKTPPLSSHRTPPASTSTHTASSRDIPNRDKLDRVEIETILVRRVTTKDMLQFTMMPYDLNCPVKKFIRSGGHPYAYIDLNTTNQFVAKEELMKINEYIIQAYDYIPSIRNKVCLHINRIVFSEYEDGYGYTQLICTPYTPSGKISKCPLSLSFMTKLNDDSYCAIGSLDYGVDGNVFKASVHISKGRGTSLKAWDFYFKTVGRTFVLYEVRSSNAPDKHSLPGTIYKFEH